ncbi:hypothetical protein [Candidatus Nitrosocosmicus sp. R]
MTNYSTEVIKCLASWTQQLQNCKGDPQCIEHCSKELRKELDTIFPSSTKLEFDNDKISYIFSTVFFLSNRLNKALIGLAEIDKAINNLVLEEQTTTNNKIDGQNREEFENNLNKILSEYY